MLAKISRVIGVGMIWITWVITVISRRVGKARSESAKQRNSGTEVEPVAADPDALKQAIVADKALGLKELLTALDRSLPTTAINQLVRAHFTGSNNTQLTSVLLQQLPKARDPIIQTDLVSTILCVDNSSNTRQSLNDFGARLGLHQRRNLKWVIDGLTFDDAVEDFVAAGLMARPTSQTIEEVQYNDGLEEQADADGEARLTAELFCCVLMSSPQAIQFEAWKPSKSVWYDELIPFVFSNATPELNIEDVSVVKSTHKITAISWTLDGRRMTEPYTSDEPLDVAWFVKMINKHLAKLGSKKRCESPELENDAIHLFVAEPNRLWPLLRKYHIAYRQSLYGPEPPEEKPIGA